MDIKKITAMRHAGIILSETLQGLLSAVRPGISELELDSLAESMITKKGGQPGFKKVPGYKHTICVSVNDVVVHGIPTNRVLQEGDIIGIDCGVFYDGYHTDMAESKIVGLESDQPKSKFLVTGKKALFAAIKQAKAGNHVGDISVKMQEGVEREGYSVVRSLVGHGVGRNLHESPEIPGYLASDSIENTPLLREGQTIAIEIIYNQGGADVLYSGDDDWTIVTKDGKLSGLFERTVLVTEKGPELITRLSSDKL